MMKSAGKRFDVAVFPLLDAVLFPGVVLPIQVVEKRYAQMLQDVQARGWPLAVSLVVPEGGQEFSISTICGAGSVQVFREYTDGRSEILVHGQQRVRLCSIIQHEPYLVMEAEPVETQCRSKTAPKHSFEDFRTLAKQWVLLNPDVSDHLSILFDDLHDFGALSDFFVFHFMKKARDKQVYLDCVDPLERSEMLSLFIQRELLKLKQKYLKTGRPKYFH